MYSNNHYMLPVRTHILDRPHYHWSKYVSRNPMATIFHQVNFINNLSEYFKFTCYYCHAFDAEDNLIGILPLMLCKNFMRKQALISLPHCVYGGIVADNAKSSQALIECALSFSKTQKVDFLLLKSIQADQSLVENLYCHFRKALSSISEENWRAIAKEKRADIRKAQTYGLTVTIHRNLDIFYQHYAFSLKRLGTPILHRAYFEKLLACLSENCKIFTAFYQGRPVASVMVFFFKEEVMPYYAGALEETRDLHAYDFLYWTLMEYAIQNGYKYFNFGRSRYNVGSFHYKRHWGFEAQSLNYQHWAISNHAQSEWSLHPNHPKWSLPIKMWKTLPVWLTVQIGPWIAKQLT